MLNDHALFGLQILAYFCQFFGSFLNNALCNRREQGNCEICYSAAAATDVHLSGTGAKVTTIVSNYNTQEIYNTEFQAPLENGRLLSEIILFCLGIFW